MMVTEVAELKWEVVRDFMPEIKRLGDNDILKRIWSDLVNQGLDGNELLGMFWWLVKQGFGRDAVEDVLS